MMVTSSNQEQKVGGASWLKCRCQHSNPRHFIKERFSYQVKQAFTGPVSKTVVIWGLGILPRNFSINWQFRGVLYVLEVIWLLVKEINNFKHYL